MHPLVFLFLPCTCMLDQHKNCCMSTSRCFHSCCPSSTYPFTSNSHFFIFISWINESLFCPPPPHHNAGITSSCSSTLVFTFLLQNIPSFFRSWFNKSLPTTITTPQRRQHQQQQLLLQEFTFTLAILLQNILSFTFTKTDHLSIPLFTTTTTTTTTITTMQAEPAAAAAAAAAAQRMAAAPWLSHI